MVIQVATSHSGRCDILSLFLSLCLSQLLWFCFLVALSVLNILTLCTVVPCQTCWRLPGLTTSHLKFRVVPMERILCCPRWKEATPVILVTWSTKWGFITAPSARCTSGHAGVIGSKTERYLVSPFLFSSDERLSSVCPAESLLRLIATTGFIVSWLCADSTGCNGTSQYWIAWGHSTLRFGFGLIPGMNDLVSASFSQYNTNTNMWLKLQTDYSTSTDWIIYRTANFSGKECFLCFMGQNR